MGGGFDIKPGGASLLSPATGTLAGVPGPGKQTLTERLGSGAPASAASSQPVQRKATDGSSGALAAGGASQGVGGTGSPRRTMELYLAGNQTHVWNVIGDHAQSVTFPDPHPRLTWTNHKAFVRELLMQLESNLGSFTPLAKLDEILYPSNAARTIGPMLPATDAWSPPLGLAISQALQIAIVSSLHRLGPRYLAASDSRGSVGGGVMNPGALIYSMPIDRYVGAAMCAPRVLTIEPPDAKADAKAAAKAKGKAMGIRPTKLAWEGARDRQLWNWVRATEPADATAEEVAAALWTVTDHHGETNAAFNAYLLAAAPPLFGIPKKFALKNPDAKQYAPAHALAGEDNVDAELADIAKSSATDDIALHQAPAGPPKGKASPAEPAPALAPLLATLADCDLQLGFATAELASWGLAAHAAPARAFVTRKSHELATADAKAVSDWNRVIAGQRDQLFKISGAIHNLTSTAKKLGVMDPKAPEATPVREILELLATAAGTSHLAQTSAAKLQQALELQAGLHARAMQATERDLEGAHLDFRATMGPSGARGAASYSHEVVDLQARSRQLQTTMINGGEVDTAAVDEVTLRSGEIALRERVLGTIHSTFELQQAALAAKDGLAAHIAMLFSGKFRNLESLCQHIRDRVVPIQSELIATEQKIRDEQQAQAGTPAQKAKHRATRRAVLAKAQAAFARISADQDLQHFFREGAKVVQNQQFRTACVKAAALIGIAVLAAATGGAAAELAGGMLMEAGGVATVAELSTLARVGITTANVVADTAVNAVGQTAVQGGSLKQAFVENLFMSFASTALFGTIARASAETARLEGREAMTWAKADRFAQKAFVAGREAGAITVHTVWGAAIGYVAHRAVGGHEPSPMEARDWMLQGASVAIGRGVHKALGARMPGLERLAKRSGEARRLVLEAHQLQQLAQKAEQRKDPAQAVELLDQRTQLLRDEVEAIDHIVAKDGDAGGELGKLRKDLQGEIHASTSHAMLETKLHLLGLEELVPGALWKGSHEQTQRALKEARASGGKAPAQDPHSQRWKLELDGRVLEIQEVAGENKKPGAHSEPTATSSGRAPSRRADEVAMAHEVSGASALRAFETGYRTHPKEMDAFLAAMKSHPGLANRLFSQFGEAALGNFKPIGDGMVSIHGEIDLSVGKLVALTNDDLAKLVEVAKNKGPADAYEYFESTSTKNGKPGARLRFKARVHDRVTKVVAEIKKSLNLVPGDKRAEIFDTDKMAEGDANRLWDLFNEGGYKDAAIRRQAAEWAFSKNPKTAREFVAEFQFYDAEVANRADRYVEEAKAELAKEISSRKAANGNKDLAEAELKAATRAATQAKLGRAFDVEGPAWAREATRKATKDMSTKVAKNGQQVTIGHDGADAAWRTNIEAQKGVDAPGVNSIGLKADAELGVHLRSIADTLSFATDFDAAYHAHKHAGELPVRPASEAELATYLRAAREFVRTKPGIVRFNQDGSRSVVYEADGMRAIVHVAGNGNVAISTFSKAN